MTEKLVRMYFTIAPGLTFKVGGSAPYRALEYVTGAGYEPPKRICRTYPGPGTRMAAAWRMVL